MKHLKLGYYSFVINTKELGLVSGTEKNFTRDELPDDLKILFDLLEVEKPSQKALYFNIIDNNDAYVSGFAIQNAGSIEINCADGNLLQISRVSATQISINYSVI